MLFRKIDGRYIVRLEKGENVGDALTAFAREQGINSGFVNGIGAIENVELGYYNLEKREYQRIRFDGEYELIHLCGNFTYVDGAPFLHAHVTISDQACKAYAGHLFSGTIAVTGEFYISASSEQIERELDAVTGLKLMKLR